MHFTTDLLLGKLLTCVDGQTEADSVAVVDSDSRFNAGRDTPEQGRVEPSAVSGSTQRPEWAPLSHKPIYPGEPGYKAYKSRVVFESEPVQADLRYSNTSFGRTITALDKFLLWRKKQVDKLNDGGLRSAPRIIILDESEPCMPLYDLDKVSFGFTFGYEPTGRGKADKTSIQLPFGGPGEPTWARRCRLVCPTAS